MDVWENNKKLITNIMAIIPEEMTTGEKAAVCLYAAAAFIAGRDISKADPYIKNPPPPEVINAIGNGMVNTAGYLMTIAAAFKDMSDAGMAMKQNL